ncbi:MAG: sigma-70 family RNA polymerase sigma factor [Ruminococcaceae bacterium]|nr:sigma-70 family RNA polymerase sigma factor [Oscillospiraceae bacterium]
MNEMYDLIKKSQAGDEIAREKLLEENSGLVWAVVRRFIGRGVETDDLYQLGCLGFLKAIEGFDPEFGTQFSTYAVPKIAGEIRRFIRDDGAVKVSRGIKERATVIKTARNALIAELGREPTINEIAGRTGLTVEDIAIAEMATANIESIHQQTGDEGFTLESVLTDTKSEDAMLEKISLDQAIGCLSEREEMVIRLRYYHGLTQERTAKVLQVSQVQVSRIEKKALSHLKSILS